MNPDEVLQRYAVTKRRTPSGLWICSDEERHYREAINVLNDWLSDAAGYASQQKKRCGRNARCVRYYNSLYVQERDEVWATRKAIYQEHIWRVQNCLEMRPDRSKRG